MSPDSIARRRLFATVYRRSQVRSWSGVLAIARCWALSPSRISHKTRNLGETLRHRIAGHLDAGGIEPGMGVERLVLALGGAEMHDAGDAAPLEHDARRHRLRQAHRLERHVARRARHRPADLLGECAPASCEPLRRGLQGARVARRHEVAETARQARKRNEDQRQPRQQQAQPPPRPPARGGGGRPGANLRSRRRIERNRAMFHQFVRERSRPRRGRPRAAHRIPAATARRRRRHPAASRSAPRCARRPR